MSLKPLRPCTAPGCPRLSRSSLCDVHALRYERDRGTPTDRGYDTRYDRLRIPCFVRDNWTCVDCGWKPELVAVCQEYDLGVPPIAKVIDELRRRFNRRERHLHADHIEPIAVRPDLRLDLNNLATRCNICHNRRTLRQIGDAA